jgi:hypothetical protein
VALEVVLEELGVELEVVLDTMIVVLEVVVPLEVVVLVVVLVLTVVLLVALPVVLDETVVLLLDEVFWLVWRRAVLLRKWVWIRLVSLMGAGVGSSEQGLTRDP